MRALLSAVLATALVASGAAAAPKGPAKARATASAPTWVVDKAHSSIGFKGVLEGDAFQGSFRRWDAKIAFDPKALAASHVSVSVDTASAFTGNGDRDETMPTDDWFAVKRFPTASFVVTRFVDQGQGRYQAIGDLTIKGVKRQVVLPFTLAIVGKTARMQGSLVLDRTQFGVGSGKWKSGEEVGTQVTVNVNLTATRAG
ncbi:MAG: YceI family protein [Proteobacteria bacterium]|nr:YceI family protein [Pseudomonadota bacterium]